MSLSLLTKRTLLASTLFLALGKISLFSQTPNFQLLDRSVVNIKVTCQFVPNVTAPETCSGRATGIVISERDGFVRILTARHAVHGLNKTPQATIELTFAFDQLKPMTAKLLSLSSEQLDLAILEAEVPKGAAGFGTLPLVWVPQTRVKAGMNLWVVDGLWEPLQGRVDSLIQDSDGQRVRYVCDAANGYSGGPVFDAAGDLLAVHLRGRAELAPNLRDGVTVDAALQWLKSIGYSAETFNRLRVSAPVSSGSGATVADTSALRPLSAGDRGTLLYRAGRFTDAKPLLTQAANAGDDHAAVILSGMYLSGQGVAVNYVEANRLAMVGAARGNDTAMNTLGASYVTGTGIGQNYVQGAHWYQLSAERGNDIGMFGLALLFVNGQINAQATAPRLPRREAPDTDAKGVYWLQRGSQAGDLRAGSLLGVMYGNGRGGLVKSDAVAVKFFRSSADQGEVMGMQLLGDWYLAGRVNGQRDFEHAVSWYKRAASLGDDTSKQRLRSIAAANPGQRY